MITINKNDIKGITLLSEKEAWELPNWILANSDWWWLRTCGAHCDTAIGVGCDGRTSLNGYSVYNDYVCVRPAIEIKNLSINHNLEIGDLVEVFNRKAQYIGNDMILLCEAIASHRFDKQSNDYEKSEVKEFVEGWLKKELEK